MKTVPSHAMIFVHHYGHVFSVSLLLYLAGWWTPQVDAHGSDFHFTYEDEKLTSSYVHGEDT